MKKHNYEGRGIEKLAGREGMESRTERSK